ncbi:phosphomethylpyrimidine kinase [Clostridium sp. OF09-36]|uniref:PfkB family carbohydrate kinase n=1 Tax=Clostridium sp. OF09-36 TaxID=2292310 RepID=UPI000E4B630F|nr:PfkB family carbohydrate kinase [Clostridium sp. OF09-36]RHV87611.1 phosphomethylpyrimidine kinase [Clostridium sp. OF09-36]
MVPLFSRMGHFPYQVPTAVVSNTLDFGKFRIQDMTDYMRDTIKVWDELGFDPDCICTGFVLSEEQVELIGDYIRSRKPRRSETQSVDNGCLVMVDPIMADGGKLYNGIGMERVAAMRKLVSYSDVMVPNMTEAGFLTGICPGRERASAAELRELVDGLHKLSGKSVVITSAHDSETDEHLVCGYDHKSGQYFRVPFTFLPVRVAGSGDIFSTVMTGKLLNGESLEAAVQEAVRVLTALIRENQSHLDEYKGILVERYWELLDENN